MIYIAETFFIVARDPRTEVIWVLLYLQRLQLSVLYCCCFYPITPPLSILYKIFSLGSRVLPLWWGFIGSISTIIGLIKAPEAVRITTTIDIFPENLEIQTPPHPKG